MDTISPLIIATLLGGFYGLISRIARDYVVNIRNNTKEIITVKIVGIRIVHYLLILAGAYYMGDFIYNNNSGKILLYMIIFCISFILIFQGLKKNIIVK